MYKTITLFIIGLIIASCTSTKHAFKKSFSAKETALIMNADSLKPMRVYKINNTKDSLLLRKKSAYIKPNSKDLDLKTFVKRLYTTVRDSASLGVGIAAPQVGILKNIIWVQRFDKEDFPFEVYLNPKIVSYSEKKQTVKEGCLSIPNRSETLDSRSLFITIDYDTMAAEHKTETVSGFTSVIFQHEIDHLNGILYLDHLKKDIKNTRP
ncbi:peptide deformylase [Algibacter pectinivorans]|uniref:Peptide deformylase n=1 Tax=Algibacter pectinivorans TaxID=870482 RepID=A0A1I1PWQ3_9FLAO|nr:peptide deformylase [Algibacter pectinivorans]SFD12018.1 peptide deformylase [Algibacter pectinivorans]